MKFRILKYPLSSPSGSIGLPYGARVISSRIDENDTIVLYAMVPMIYSTFPLRRFFCLNTGEDFDEDTLDDMLFINTVRSSNGIVWHVFVQHYISVEKPYTPDLSSDE